MKRNSTGPKVAREKDTVAKMIRLYCRKQHRRAELCCECRELQLYAEQRLSCCRFGEAKPTCAQCHIHCYRPAEAARMKAVMRFSGPRMIFYHPLTALRHLLKNIKSKKGKMGR